MSRRPGVVTEDDDCITATQRRRAATVDDVCGTAAQPRRAVTGDGGYSTVIVLALAAVLIMIAGLLAAVGSVTVARHRAEAVADVAALAAAQHAQEGSVIACGVAALLTAQQHASLLSCRLDDLDAVVVVGIRPPGRAGSLGWVRGRARAGRRGDAQGTPTVTRRGTRR